MVKLISHARRTQGTETSKYLQEEKSTEIVPVAASERTLAQTYHACMVGVVGLQRGWAFIGEQAGKLGQRGWKPRILNRCEPSRILSRTGHVESCLNPGGPPSKAKYSLLTDSVPVPWGKDEKNPDKGSEIDLETNYLQTVKGLL